MLHRFKSVPSPFRVSCDLVISLFLIQRGWHLTNEDYLYKCKFLFTHSLSDYPHPLVTTNPFSVSMSSVFFFPPRFHMWGHMVFVVTRVWFLWERPVFCIFLYKHGCLSFSIRWAGCFFTFIFWRCPSTLGKYLVFCIWFLVLCFL